MGCRFVFGEEVAENFEASTDEVTDETQREQKAEEKESERQCEEEEIQCQQEGAEALPQNEEPDRSEEISEETDDAPSDEGINVNSSSSRESSLERHEVEPKLEPGDNEVQLQREERQARLEQEKAKAEQERAKAEQEKAKAEQEKAKAEQEKFKVGQERAKAEQKTAKAELAMIKMEAAKAEQERIKTARRENRVMNEKSRSRTSSESEDEGAKRETNRYPGNRESSKAPQSAGSVPARGTLMRTFYWSVDGLQRRINDDNTTNPQTIIPISDRQAKDEQFAGYGGGTLVNSDSTSNEALIPATRVPLSKSTNSFGDFRVKAQGT
ncbi:caldesmon-like [Procambarus clarkii]|uniref:caldesmon-like n=1 Tax=Procambarus clarkii TaxID=6728 RepID=UPI003743D551